MSGVSVTRNNTGITRSTVSRDVAQSLVGELHNAAGARSAASSNWKIEETAVDRLAGRYVRSSTERLAVTYLSRHPAAREDDARAFPSPPSSFPLCLSLFFSLHLPIHLLTSSRPFGRRLPPSLRFACFIPCSLFPPIPPARPSPGLFNFRFNFLPSFPRAIRTARRLVASSPTQIKTAIDVEGSTGARTVFVNNVKHTERPVLRGVIERHGD